MVPNRLIIAFRQCLNLDADFNCRDGSTRNLVSRINDGSLVRNNVSEGSIAAATRNTAPFVVNVQNAVPRFTAASISLAVNRPRPSESDAGPR
jgi:hypothetical protein